MEEEYIKDMEECEVRLDEETASKINNLLAQWEDKEEQN